MIPTQVVPKKSGVTDVKNEHDELIPTHVILRDFSVFGDSFDSCLHNLELILTRREEKGLVLNWEKCHFMVSQGMVLGHIVSKKGIQVDKSKNKIISNLPTQSALKTFNHS